MNQSKILTAPKTKAIIPQGVVDSPFVCGALFLQISGIYKIQSKIKSERIYIGSAINLKNRWRAHKSDLRLNKHSNEKLQNHYNKYGESDLIFTAICECSKEEMIAFEQFYIDLLSPYFNICKIAGSLLGTKRSDEVKRLMSKQRAGIKVPFRHRGDNPYINTYNNITKEERNIIIKNAIIKKSDFAKTHMLFDRRLKYSIKPEVYEI